MKSIFIFHVLKFFSKIQLVFYFFFEIILSFVNLKNLKKIENNFFLSLYLFNLNLELYSNESFFFTTQFFFFFFSIAALLSVIFLYLTPNPVNSILHLVLVFLNVAFLILLLEVEYIALTFMVVYIGAISMLFVFVIMMLDIRKESLLFLDSKFKFSYKVCGFFLFILILLEFYLLIFDSFNFIKNADLLASNLMPPQILLGETGFLFVGGLSFEPELGGFVDNVHYGLTKLNNSILPWDKLDPFLPIQKKFLYYRLGLDDVGHFLYTYYFVYLCLAGFILLIPMLGAIVLTNRFKEISFYTVSKFMIPKHLRYYNLFCWNYNLNKNIFKNKNVFLFFWKIKIDYDLKTEEFVYINIAEVQELVNTCYWIKPVQMFVSQSLIESVSIGYLLMPSVLLFILGLFGLAFVRKHILIYLMALEIMLLGISLTLIIFSCYLTNPCGYILVLLILCVAAAEVVIALAIAVSIYRNMHAESIAISSITNLRF